METTARSKWMWLGLIGVNVIMVAINAIVNSGFHWSMIVSTIAIIAISILWYKTHLIWKAIDER